MRNAPCDSKGFVGDFGSRVRDGELILAEECVTLPSKDGVIAETTQDSITEWQKQHLQHKEFSSFISTTFSNDSLKINT